MEVLFGNKFKKEELGIRVRAILGVPEEVLTDDIIFSPTFKTKAEKYVNRKISEYDEDKYEIDEDLLGIAYLYHICYSLCIGMYARLPKQMEDLSTKTVLQSIDWDKLALKCLDDCNEMIDEAIEDAGEDVGIGNTFAVLSAESQYPNTSI